MKTNHTNEQLQAAIDEACIEIRREHRGKVGTSLVIDTAAMPGTYKAEASARLDLIKSALAALPEQCETQRISLEQLFQKPNAIADELQLSQLRPLAEAGEVPEGCVRVTAFCVDGEWIIDSKGIHPGDTHFADTRLPEPAEKPDPYAELKAAHADGKVIQYRNANSSGGWSEWHDYDGGKYMAALIPIDGHGGYREWRIKPSPETFEAHSKTWTSHTPGDAMPCDGSKLVHTLWKCESPPKELLAKDNEADLASSWNWSKRDDDSDIIGWCYADEPTSEPLVTKPISLPTWTPAVGDVVTLKSGGPKMTVMQDIGHNFLCAYDSLAEVKTVSIPTNCLQPA
jgi:uncharacterized protein YodC (DUF2158 family)